MNEPSLRTATNKSLSVLETSPISNSGLSHEHCCDPEVHSNRAQPICATLGGTRRKRALVLGSAPGGARASRANLLEQAFGQDLVTTLPTVRPGPQSHQLHVVGWSKAKHSFFRRSYLPAILTQRALASSRCHRGRNRASTRCLRLTEMRSLFGREISLLQQECSLFRRTGNFAVSH